MLLIDEMLISQLFLNHVLGVCHLLMELIYEAADILFYCKSF